MQHLTLYHHREAWIDECIHWEFENSFSQYIQLTIAFGLHILFGVHLKKLQQITMDSKCPRGMWSKVVSVLSRSIEVSVREYGQVTEKPAF